MKQIYLTFLSFLLVLTTLSGQSKWLTPNDGYVSNDIISDKAFSCHDILGNNLYAIDSDGLYCYDLTTMQQTKNFGKSPDYNGWVSFVTADPDGTKIWVGYTKSGLTDDRIYSVDITTGTWTHVATFPGNFDMECYDGNYYVSGLNTEGWDGVNDINCISLLDLSGNNEHKKLIEIGGNSTGLAIDATGNVYNAKYDPTGSTSMYQWSTASVKAVIDATDGSFLTLEDGTEITSIPGNGPYDCTVDDAGNMIFNCNDFTGKSFIARWNGNTGSEQNYEILGTYGGSSFAWFSMVQATGDVTADGTAYMINFGDPIAAIRVSKAPSINGMISDYTLPVNTAQTVINLADYYTAKDGATIDYSVSAASNSIIESTQIDGTSLTITYNANASGQAEVTVSGISSGDAANISFSTELRQVDYTKGVFIVNEDWFGHSNGTVNYLTGDNKFIYRSFQAENTQKELGVTSQFGTIYNDQFFIMSKQGNRMVVSDAATMSQQATVENFVANEQGNSSDGRAFVGVTPQKGYISTSKGIYLFDITNLTVGEKIEGTSGEVGNMLRAGNYVFAEKSDEVYVINAKTDQIVKSITGGSLSGVVQSFDGFVWIGAGSKLIKVDPISLNQEEIVLPSGIQVPSSFGWAWNAGSFCASATENSLYWAKPGGWSGSNIIYKYVIGDETSLDAPFITLESGMEMYGAGLRVHPETNKVYVTGKKSGWGDSSLTNILYAFDGTTGAEVSRHEMESYYWFPALPVFPDAYAPELNLSDIDFVQGDASQSFSITDLVSDRDNNDASILLSVVANTDNSVADVSIENGQLIVAPKAGAVGTTTVTLQAVSNGKTTQASFDASVNTVTGIENNLAVSTNVYPTCFTNQFTIEGTDLAGYSYKVYNVNGQPVLSGNLQSDRIEVEASELNQGIYIIVVETLHGTISKRIIKQ